ncbi:hypothetical protein BCR33DRAFT_204287 [Rhizoclosmatium globosum]|uniref:Uncharacterized protein n=1 Tax=Rhizoclosmatium globosum TaxID=329046 RepID=A0A1Y2AFQ7_9FUNG|nr:hypothetical protein BCR33DRAFT_204287 [Rhizoclosmatium globosum]|eukprot:ORY21381.1 hypothetical protein BCR33DRAFT_204287 [Rhizoclosmatium globosum]
MSYWITRHRNTPSLMHAFPRQLDSEPVVKAHVLQKKIVNSPSKRQVRYFQFEKEIVWNHNHSIPRPSALSSSDTPVKVPTKVPVEVPFKVPSNKVPLTGLL